MLRCVVKIVSSDVEMLESFCLIGGIPVIIVSQCMNCAICSDGLAALHLEKAFSGDPPGGIDFHPAVDAFRLDSSDVYLVSLHFSLKVHGAHEK